MRIPIASEGWRFIIPALVLGAGLLLVPVFPVQLFGVLSLLFAVACAGFFRDFDRATPLDDKLIYSPGDGKVLEVGIAPDGPYKDQRIIRIFLSVLDGHVQRSPIEADVAAVNYQKGLFLDARDPQAHVRNEQSAMTLTNRFGTIVVIQIAGLIARRIVCWAKQGQKLGQGERYGLIRFGSQVDVFMPVSTQPRVAVGDRVWGGISVLAEWKI